MQNSFEILLWAIFPQIYRCIHHKYSSTRFKHLEWWMTEKNTSTLLILQFYWCSDGMAQCSEAALFSGGGSWDAGSNPFQFLSFFLSSYFYPSAFYCLFSLLTLLASRDFCENVFLVMLKRNSIDHHYKFGARQKWEPAGRIGDFINFLNGFAKSPRLIVLNTDWVQFVLKNYEILHSVRGLHDTQYCFTSDVMYKEYKRLVYRSPDLLERFCKVNLSKAKNSAWFVFQA